MTSTKTRARTAVTVTTNYSQEIIPDYLPDIPAELEDVAEELRAAVMEAHDAHLARIVREAVAAPGVGAAELSA